MLNDLQNHYAVVVVGSGPAGALTARLLAQRGHRTLLVERAALPRHKVCGCCLNQISLHALEQAGLPNLIDQLGGTHYTHLDAAIAGKTTTIALPQGRALSRFAMDQALADAAREAGADLSTETLARLHPSDARQLHRTLTLQHKNTQRTITADLLIDATGLSGRFTPESEAPWQTSPSARMGIGTVAPASAAGFDQYEIGKIYMACSPHGYLGLVRLENHQLDLAAAVDPAFLRSMTKPGHAAEHILEQAGLPNITGLTDLKWKGTPTLTRRRTRIAAHRLFLVGDATGYVEPFTGEGMAWALSSAHLLAPILHETLTHQATPQAAAARWQALHQQHIRRRQRICHGVAALLRRPRLTRFVLATVRHAPTLSRPLTAALNAHLVPAR